MRAGAELGHGVGRIESGGIVRGGAGEDFAGFAVEVDADFELLRSVRVGDGSRCDGGGVGRVSTVPVRAGRRRYRGR